ncbi:hypothetical protein BB14905_18695 [Bacillus sp. B14905]|nr:hypothetical protein BB14905_18695 [Bacillus sp. B14905]
MQFLHPIIVFYFPFQGIDLGADRDFLYFIIHL